MTVPGFASWYYVGERRSAQRPLTVEVVADAILRVAGGPYWCDMPTFGYPDGIHSRTRKLIREHLLSLAVPQEPLSMAL